jgi:hypothetical protein
MKLDPAMQIVADVASVGVACTEVGSLYTNYRLGNGPNNPVAVHEGGHSFPIFADPLAGFPTFSASQLNACNLPKLTIDKKSAPTGTYAFSPGAIVGKTNIDKKYVVDLTAPGDYTFCELFVNDNAEVRVGPGTRVFIVKDFEINGGRYGVDENGVGLCGDTGTSLDTPMYVLGEGIGKASSVDFGRDSEMWSQIWSAKGNINLGHGNFVHGHIWGERMQSDKNNRIETCGDGALPTTTTTTTTSTTTTTTTTVPDPTTSTSTSTTTTTTEPEPDPTTSTSTTTTTEPETIPETTTSTTLDEFIPEP